MKTGETLMSRRRAQEALKPKANKFMPTVWGVNYFGKPSGTISYRPCSIGKGARRYLTGGAVVSMQVNDPSYMVSLEERERPWRLQGPVTLIKLSRALARAENELRRLSSLRQARLRLHERFTNADPKHREASTTHAARAKVEHYYAHMTHEDVQHWNDWLDKREGREFSRDTGLTRV